MTGARTAGKTLLVKNIHTLVTMDKQRREILANQPVDPDIIPFRTALLFYQKQVRAELVVLQDRISEFPI